MVPFYFIPGIRQPDTSVAQVCQEEQSKVIIQIDSMDI